MKKICLYYFSGTGMTNYIIDRLSSEFKKHHIFVDCFKIEEVDAHHATLSEYDALGIAYPTHSLNAPKLVIDFAKKLPQSEGMNTFIIYTCSANSPANYASSSLLIKKLSKRGYRVFYDKLIEMPSNFAHKLGQQAVLRTLDKANKDIPHIADEIVELKAHFMENGTRSKILTSLARAEWIGAPIMGKFFAATSDCTRCGKCVEQCPTKNIVMKKKSVGFKWRCGLCMRCVYQCPEHAIKVRQPFKFISLDSWYDSELFK